jgi:NADPH2:quinone reductase
MRAAQCASLDGPAGIRLVNVPPPPMGPGDIRIAVSYAAVNFMDLLVITGQYQFKPTLPFTPGHDAAGTVLEVGSAVDNFRVGDRVSIGVSIGAFAQEVVAPASRTVLLPDEIDFRTAAAYRASYATALYALRERALLKKDETLVVTGAAGGVGLATLQIARIFGAKTIGIVGSDAKANVVAAEGADALVSGSRDGLRDEIVKRFPNGFDVALDTVGGPGFLELMRAAAWDARLLVVGFANGISTVPTNRVLLRSASIIGVNYGAAQDKNLTLTADIHKILLQWIKVGQLKPLISAEFPLTDIGEALTLLASRGSTGKIVIRVQ